MPQTLEQRVVYLEDDVDEMKRKMQELEDEIRRLKRG